MTEGLFTRQWSDGDRVAVLIHGIFNLGEGWHATAAELASRGFAVTTVDLPGHGHSPRYPHYGPDMIRDLVVEAVPHSPDLLMGHSLGAFTSRLIAEPVGARSIVYVDPAFSITAPTEELRRERRDEFAGYIHITEADVRHGNPTWSDEDVRIELLGRELFDHSFVDILLDERCRNLPAPAPVPTLVLAAEHNSAITPEDARALTAAGCELRTVPGTTHNMNRDDHAAFIAALEGWI